MFQTDLTRTYLQNWIPYGYHIFDRDFDEFAHHSILFVGISIVMCWGFFYLCYFPDYRLVISIFPQICF